MNFANIKGPDSEDPGFTYQAVYDVLRNANTPYVLRGVNVHYQNDVVTVKYVFTLPAGYSITQYDNTVFSLTGTTLTSIKRGISDVTVTGPYGDRVLRLQATIADPNFNYVFDSFPNGSLAKYIDDKVNSYFSGNDTDPNAVVKIWTTATSDGTAAGTVCVPNPNRVAQELDMSWMCAFNVVLDANGQPSKAPAAITQNYSISLISPRHAVVAKHVGFQNRAIFRRTDGTMIEANIVKQETPALANGATADLQICQFDRDVTGCENVWIFPKNLTDYIPSLNIDWVKAYPQDPISNQYLSPFTYPRNPNILASYVRENHGFSGAYFDGGRKIQPVKMVDMEDYVEAGGVPVSQAIANYSQGYINNDSGSPWFVPMPLNGKMVCVLLASMGGGAPALNKFVDALNTSMNRMATQAGLSTAGTYACKVYDLSAYPKYV